MTDANGAIISQTKYKAWGEVRQATGTSPTNYTLRQAQGTAYTGQYSYTADFGLMFYNARWYDPALGRFAQADSIVPGGVQGLDRYAYVNNSPMNYVDPSGHFSCSQNPNSDDYCPPTGGGGSNRPSTDPRPRPNGRGSQNGGGGQSLPPLNTSGCGVTMSCLPTSGPFITNPVVPNGNGSATVIAVPAPQPNGSPSVPTITTYSSSTSTNFNVISSSSGPVLETHFPSPVDIPVLEYLEFTHYVDGEPAFSTEIELEFVVYYPDQYRVISETTVTITTITSYDQNGSVLGVNEVVNYSSAEQPQVGYSNATNLPLTEFWVPFNNPVPNIVYR